MQTLLLGYGNPLRGDDAVGLVVAERLLKFSELPTNPSLTVLQRHQLLPELAEPISQAEQVVFVDAAVGENPGEVNCTRIFAAERVSSDFSHHVTPEILLAYAATLYGRCPPATLISITGKTFALTEELSEEVEGGVDTAVALIESLI